MTHFIKNGNIFNVANEEAIDIHKTLPAANYVVKKNDMTGQFYLETIDSFNISGKIYGDTLKNTERILRTFEDRPATTGVMLAGEKGSGKSLLAKMISQVSAERGYPTIVINAPWCGDAFNAFMQMINQPCVILFDEFEKVYDKDDQEQILTLLDGVFPSKKLFVLTCNDKYRIDAHMRNRPGRIFYMIDFVGLGKEFIEEYCNDRLNDKSYIDKIVKISMVFDQFNFDMLKALVEEMNRYGETPQEAMRMLNAKPEFGGNMEYKVSLKVNGKLIESADIIHEFWTGNPLTRKVHLEYKKTVPVEVDPDGWVWEDSDWGPSDISDISSVNGTFTYSNVSGDTLVLSRKEEKVFNYMAF